MTVNRSPTTLFNHIKSHIQSPAVESRAKFRDATCPDSVTITRSVSMPLEAGKVVTVLPGSQVDNNPDTPDLIQLKTPAGLYTLSEHRELLPVEGERRISHHLTKLIAKPWSAHPQGEWMPVHRLAF